MYANFRHASQSLQRYQELEKTGFGKPLNLQVGSTSFQAFINDKLSPSDKLSQVNTLLQIQNIASYKFMNESLMQKLVQIHALWFEISTGEVHVFSKKEKVNNLQQYTRA